MNFFLNLSFRYKVPLWGSVLIVVTALAVSASLMMESYDELKEDLLIDSKILGRSLATNLFPALLHDDIWHAFEIVSAPILDVHSTQIPAESILVVDNARRVIVSAHPKKAPMLADLRDLGSDYAALAERIAAGGENADSVVELPGSRYYYFLTPISDGSTQLGTLIIVYPQNVFMPRFLTIAGHGLSVGAVVLAILLPFNWYWGWRMTLPLAELTSRMGEIGRQWPARLDPGLYAHRDELGRLFEAYNQMLVELKAKQALEAQVVQSERLAALGQLAAGIAHEINNPLSGMLTAIDTLKHHSDADPRTLKTMDLIERGLSHIKDTVGALLVEARVKSRNFAPQDIEDILTLISPQARHKALHLTWHNQLGEEIPVPATLLRQIIINLLLNAVQAAAQQGEVAFDIHLSDGYLHFAVSNDGKMLTEEQIAHLFEPFSPLSEEGHGLGLWVTYQIVHQLGGVVAVARESAERMRFTVDIPLGGSL
ncbi:MAG: HAMP domain-containing histidine kinase [Sulfuricella sp.]|nr:HAMP domain-containing histidine kinase [Sulfuricella sp.]